MNDSAAGRQIGFVLFAGVTQLDLTGPWEVLTRLGDTTCHLLSHDLAPVRSASGGLTILPTMTYAACPQLDMVCVPGGPGHVDAMRDDVLLEFLRRQAAGCRFVTAVCTGTMVLAAAGLLRGFSCTTHWLSRERLARFGAKAEDRRVVVDGSRITGAGVTAGIDFALTVAAAFAGEMAAREIQLQIEYAPEPPFEGSVGTAGADIVAALRGRNPDYARRMVEADVAAALKLG